MKRPAAFLLENVKNLKSHDKGRTFKIIMETLDELGYWVADVDVNDSTDPKVIDGQHFVPQHRERIVLVGFRRDLNIHKGFTLTDIKKVFPKKKPKLGDILDESIDDKYILTPKLWEYLFNYSIKHKAKGNGFGYLINPFGLLYEEITASSLVKVDVNGRLVEDVALDVNPAAFVIHGAIHQARPEIECVLHTHTRAGVGVAAQAHGLLPISQHAFKVYDRVAYHDFEGIALDMEEQKRLVADIESKDVLILRNHGLLTMGRTVREAFELMYYLERACEIQVAALAGKSEVIIPSSSVCERTCAQFSNDSSYVKGRDWQALLRLLDRTDPSYKD